KIDNYDQSGSAVVIAHSQGNLLANLAYAKLVSKYGNDIRKKILIVNIANTSEFSANNLNLTQAGDRALYPSYMNKDLTTLPSQKSWSRTTPRCSNDFCNFSLLSPTLGAVDTGSYNPFNIPDSNLQHSITATYLSNFVVDTIIDQQGVTLSDLKQRRFVDLFEDFVYMAANAVNRGIYPNNLLKGSTVTSTGTCGTLSQEAKVITDGNLETGHNLCTYSGIVNITLPAPVTLKKLLIRPEMTPEGSVSYEVQTYDTMNGWVSRETASAVWRNNQDIEVDLSTTNYPISEIAITVHSSPSWVAYREVQGF
ncbi:MAG: hypothetical protein WAQ53_18600, partial [Thiofilum sp.]